MGSLHEVKYTWTIDELFMVLDYLDLKEAAEEEALRGVNK
jgi:hypothetical protein